MSYKKSKNKTAPAKFIPQLVGGLAGAGGALLAGEGLEGAIAGGAKGALNPAAGVGGLVMGGIEKATAEKPVAKGTQPVTQVPVDPNIAGGGIANEQAYLTEQELISNQTGIPSRKEGELKQNSSYNSTPVFNTSSASKMKGYYKKK